MNKRFEVSFKLNIYEGKEDKAVPFFDGEIAYHDMPYDGVVAVQNVLIETLGRLNEMGLNTAVAMGLSEKLCALGLTEQVMALQAKV